MEADQTDELLDQAVQDEVRVVVEGKTNQARIRARGYITKYAAVMDRLG